MLLGILLAAVIVVCIALVGVILLQRSEGGVLGMSGGGPGNFMSTRGTGDLLTRTTQILAAIFFGLCLAMTLITGHIRRDASIASKLKDLSISPPPVSRQVPSPATPAPLTAAAPTSALPASPAPTLPAPVPSSDGLNLFGNASAPAPKPARHAAARSAASAPAEPTAPAATPPGQ